jgi:hypothetical protein
MKASEAFEATKLAILLDERSNAELDRILHKIKEYTQLGHYNMKWDMNMYALTHTKLLNLGYEIDGNNPNCYLISWEKE